MFAARVTEGAKRHSHHFARFDLSGMIECGRSVRALAQHGDSMEHAAQLLVRYFRHHFTNPETGVGDCVLVRCFKTHRSKDLPAALRSKAPQLPAAGAAFQDVPCLTLLATAGDADEWNDRTASQGHAVIPLESVEVVERAPMIAQLIRQMGLEIASVLQPSDLLLLEADQRAYGVFHVENAVGSTFIPSQNFVQTYRIQSVLGLGGLLPSGDLFSLILFSRTSISRETATLFRTIALSVKLVLLPFTRGPIFVEEVSTLDQRRSRSFEDEQLRSEIATLRLLIPALEEAALFQTSRLQGAVVDLRQQAEEVQKLDTRLASMLESTSDAVYMLDRQWRFTYLNRRAARLLRDDDGLLGKNLWEEFPAAVNSAFWTNYRRAVSESAAVKFVEYYPDPLDRWFEVHAFPSDDGLAIFFHDVTEMRLANEALIKNEKLAAVGRLAASIAHEINNPLESVTNLLFLAQASPDLDAVKGYLATADRELRRVGAIASQTLRFHRQSSKPTAVGCAELFADVLSVYQGRVVNCRIRVEQRNRGDARIRCFEGEIRQALNNLVANAIDAMQSGGRLHLRSRDAIDWKTGRAGVMLTVADTGAGMAPRTLARSFEAFFSTKGMAGTGLGLWITKGIVDRHQGKILCRSSQRVGSTGTVFALFLPYSFD